MGLSRYQDVLFAGRWVKRKKERESLKVRCPDLKIELELSIGTALTLLGQALPYGPHEDKKPVPFFLLERGTIFMKLMKPLRGRIGRHLSAHEDAEISIPAAAGPLLLWYPLARLWVTHHRSPARPAD